MINFLNFIYKFFNRILRLNIKLGFKIFYLVVTNNISKYPNYVSNFEKKIAKKFNSNYSLTFSSGTGACYSAILSLGQNKSSNVFVSKMTFPSTINSLLSLNYNIHYFDFDENFNPIFSTMNDNIIPDLAIITHPFGFPVGRDFIKIIKNKFKNIKIIFDCSHTQGAKFNNKYLNEYADLTFLSMQGSKAISGGEGGLVLTNNIEYLNRMMELSHPGKKHDKVSKLLTGVSMSIKLRMHPLAAAIAESNLDSLEIHNHNITKKINIIYKLLSKNKNFVTPKYYSSEIGGFHYGLPFFCKVDLNKIDNNSFVPISFYNWPDYEKNSFYDEKNFKNENFSKFEEKYYSITPIQKNKDTLLSELLFIDLNWIRYNSEKFIKDNMKNFLNNLN